MGKPSTYTYPIVTWMLVGLCGAVGGAFLFMLGFIVPLFFR